MTWRIERYWSQGTATIQVLTNNLEGGNISVNRHTPNFDGSSLRKDV